MLPTPIAQRPKFDRRLKIKSSLPDPEKAFAALYLIWKGTGEQTEINYADNSRDGELELKIDNSLFDDVYEYWSSITFINKNDFKTHIEDSPLFKSQIEPLQVLYNLYWKVAKITFIDDHKNAIERDSGGKRFLKKIEVSSSLESLDFTILPQESEKPSELTFKTIYGWLKGEIVDNLVSNKLIRHLSILSENVWFQHENLIFMQDNIYSTLKTSSEPIAFEGEKYGPLRILNSVISKGLHPILEKSGNGIIYRSNYDDKYIQRVSNYLDITNLSDKDTDVTINEENTSENGLPRNLILYGAPGTGKSYALKNRIEHLNPHKFERVTFYSDYTYSQFVGGYKPVSVYLENEKENIKVIGSNNEDLKRPGSPAIEYRFVAGPLLKLCAEAIENSDKKYLLIIEELNRADAASVFGDFFQLLDRDKDGASEYGIKLSSEAQEFLKSKNVNSEYIGLPENLYIWSSLNSADQGVFPIDTAFKRRWEFEYLPLNKNQNVVDDISIELKTKDAEGKKININWNILREKINVKLSELNIQEDLMIGPFFLSKNEINDDSSFKYKLLAYLRDDILRHQYHEFFVVEGTLDKIIQEYDNGKNIFNFDL